MRRQNNKEKAPLFREAFSLLKYLALSSLSRGEINSAREQLPDQTQRVSIVPTVGAREHTGRFEVKAVRVVINSGSTRPVDAFRADSAHTRSLALASGGEEDSVISGEVRRRFYVTHHR